METIYRCCAGLDVHKESVEACVRGLEADGRLQQETRHWGTMTGDLEALGEWLAARGVTHVAMESTGCSGNRSSISWRAGSVFCW
jgi:transposase